MQKLPPCPRRPKRTLEPVNSREKTSSNRGDLEPVHAGITQMGRIILKTGPRRIGGRGHQRRYTYVTLFKKSYFLFFYFSKQLASSGSEDALNQVKISVSSSDLVMMMMVSCRALLSCDCDLDIM